MDAAIGRLHVSITMAQPVEHRVTEPVRPDPEECIERTHRRNTQLAASEADRARWSLISRFPCGPRP
jgi:hypothetical protein